MNRRNREDYWLKKTKNIQFIYIGYNYYHSAIYFDNSLISEITKLKRRIERKNFFPVQTQERKAVLEIFENIKRCL